MRFIPSSRFYISALNLRVKKTWKLPMTHVAFFVLLSKDVVEC